MSANRGGLHPEEATRLLGGVAEHRGQDDRGALGGAQRPKDPKDLVTILDGREVVDARRERHPPPDRQGRPAVPAAEAVHCRSEQEASGVVHAAHAIPSLPDLEMGVLHDLLRLVAVPGDEAKPAEQALMRLLEEGLEAGVCLGHLVPFGHGGRPPDRDRHRAP